MHNETRNATLASENDYLRQTGDMVRLLDSLTDDHVQEIKTQLLALRTSAAGQFLSMVWMDIMQQEYSNVRSLTHDAQMRANGRLDIIEALVGEQILVALDEDLQRRYAERAAANNQHNKGPA